ncbi:MAG TPA: DUF5674 family protein [Candidatus Paceibacterota bacterium]
MEMRVIKNKIPRSTLKDLALKQFGNMVKAVVDVKQGIMAIGGELHADEEVLLSEQEGSGRDDTWGINLYPDESGEKFIEFDSMVNIKPALGNRSRDVLNAETRKKIRAIVQELIIL